MPRKRVVVGVTSACILAAGAVLVFGIHKRGDTSNTSDISLIDPITLDSLKKKSTSAMSTTHLAEGLTPPTNKWFSSMVLNKEPKPGFNVPNSIAPHNDGFELGLPVITSQSEGIYGPHVNGIQLSAKDATLFKLVRYDELTLTLAYYDSAGKELFEVTFAAGSPYGFVVAKRDIDVSLRSGEARNTSSGLTTFKNNGRFYGAKASNGTNGSTLRLYRNDELAVFSASKQADLTVLAKKASSPITSGAVTYEIHGSKVTTSLSYVTKSNGQALLVHMPHQVSHESPSAFYPSLYGELKAYPASKIEYTQPLEPLAWSLDLSGLASAERTALTSQLQTDIRTSKLDKPDTYFGGKQLERLAQLVLLADTLRQPKLRDEALHKLTPALGEWFDSDMAKSFYYDTTAKAVIGHEASFGSDKELNDHHFHYGYIIYAASVVAKFDEDFLKKHEADINLLVADIANYTSNESLPVRRNFDAYAGHSWAGGIANYADGNNQESSGEAVNAWTAAGLWADVTKNNDLKDEAEWLLANEIAAAKAYWLTRPKTPAYTSPLVSINWGGKREYKTFFSDEPNAKLAIQLLPLNPTMKAYVDTLPEQIFKGTDVNKLYGDYILMAKGDRNKFDLAKKFPQALVDDGNSKAYMMAYILAQ